MTNSFDMTGSPHGDACAMYLAIARINHSCMPNAQQTHHPDTGEEVLYACRTIEAGEEINDSYIELRQGKAERRRELEDLYRFYCDCPSCGREDKEDEQDRQRQKAKELDDLVVAVASEDGPDMAMQVALDALRLLQTEVNLHWSVRYLPDAHVTISQLANSCGLRSLAREHAKLGYEMSLLLQGLNLLTRLRQRGPLGCNFDNLV